VPDTAHQYAYLAVLVFVLLTTLPLELLLGVRVWRRPVRLSLTVLPVVAVFVLWDLYAIQQQHWFFDPAQMTGVTFGSLPLEELLFFAVVPIAAVMTLEAVRVVRRWPVGDEPRDAGHAAAGRGAEQPDAAERGAAEWGAR
jgi:lycopene cyclase domain-containing protein